jgi:hypothetical protein
VERHHLGRESNNMNTVVGMVAMFVAVSTIACASAAEPNEDVTVRASTGTVDPADDDVRSCSGSPSGSIDCNTCTEACAGIGEPGDHVSSFCKRCGSCCGAAQ